MSPARKSAHGDIAIQRAYENPMPHDGYRVLVDRFRPRGRSKDVLKLDEWARDLAPTPELIRWFGHDPARWEKSGRVIARNSPPRRSASACTHWSRRLAGTGPH